jgi:hypothetical protein
MRFWPTPAQVGSELSPEGGKRTLSRVAKLAPADAAGSDTDTARASGPTYRQNARPPGSRCRWS